MADIVASAKAILAAAEANANGDAAAHTRLRKEIDTLTLLVDSSAEKIARIRFQPLQNFALAIAVETGTLQALANKGDKPITAIELAEEVKTDHVVTYRSLRVLSSIGFLSETAPATFAANATTHAMVAAPQIGGMRMYQDCIFPVIGAVKALVAGPGINEYPRPGIPAPFEAHWGEKFMRWLDANPEYRQAFADYMSGRRDPGLPQWFEVFPAETRAAESKDSLEKEGSVLLVDVGGNKGHEAIKFRRSSPAANALPGRIIIQDLAGMLTTVDTAAVSAAEGVEFQPYDFMTPQPIKGARFYYFRAVLHNWNDEPAAKILANVAAAMSKGYSSLLIDEFVLPDTGASTRSGSLDLAMMLLGIGQERTYRQWQALLGGAGLEIVKVWKSETGLESVIEARLKE